MNRNLTSHLHFNSCAQEAVLCQIFNLKTCMDVCMCCYTAVYTSTGQNRSIKSWESQQVTQVYTTPTQSCSFSVTSLVYLRFSFSQISNRRSSWISLAKGLKRNLEHLEVRGSIILQNTQAEGQDQSHTQSVFLCWWLSYVSWPADVVTDEAEAGGAGLLLHGPPESSLSCTRHGVCLVQDDDLKRRTRLPTTKNRDTDMREYSECSIHPNTVHTWY